LKARLLLSQLGVKHQVEPSSYSQRLLLDPQESHEVFLSILPIVHFLL